MFTLWEKDLLKAKNQFLPFFPEFLFKRVAKPPFKELVGM